MPTIRFTFTGLMLFARHASDNPVEVVLFRPPTDHSTGHRRDHPVHVAALHVPAGAEDPSTTTDKRVLNGKPFSLTPWDKIILGRGGAPVTGKVTVDDTAVVKPPDKPVFGSFGYIPQLIELFSEAPDEAVSGEFANVHLRWRLHGGKLFTEPPSDPKGASPWTWIDNKNAKQVERYLTDIVVFEFTHDGTKPVALAFLSDDGDPPPFTLGLNSTKDISCTLSCEPISSGPNFEISHLGILAECAFPPTVRDGAKKAQLFGRDVLPYSRPEQCPDDPLCPSGSVKVSD